jgi:4-amino-4-deoxy-L-arabinose transferase-like glycosyltransferase
MRKNKIGELSKHAQLLLESYIIPLALVEITLLILSIPFYKLNGDEAWCAEEAYFMAQKGYSTSNFFSGFIQEDVRVVVQHKLFIYLGAALFKLFHFGLFIFRLIPILSFAFLMILFVRYQQRHPPLNSKRQLFLSVAIVLAAHEFFYFVKVARPEMLVTFLGFLSFYLLKKYFEIDAPWTAILSGLCAGLAMLAHLNGVIFILTGVSFLLFRKKVLTSLFFLAAAIIAFSPYILDVCLHYHIFKVQFYNPYIVNKTHFTFFKPFINLSREHERLFRKPEIIIPSVLFFFCLFADRKELFGEELREFTIYTLLLMLFLGLVVEDKTIKYSTYLVPFWGIVIARGIFNIDRKNKTLVSTSFVLLSLLFISGFYWQSRAVFDKENYPPLNKLIAHEMPLHSTCVAPMNFIFNEIANYKIFSDYLIRYEKFGRTITTKSLSDFCRKNNCQYVVFNKYGDLWDYVHDYTDTAELLKDFKIVAANSNYVVLKFHFNFSGSQTKTYYPQENEELSAFISYMSNRVRSERKHNPIFDD